MKACLVLSLQCYRKVVDPIGGGRKFQHWDISLKELEGTWPFCFSLASWIPWHTHLPLPHPCHKALFCHGSSVVLRTKPWKPWAEDTFEAMTQYKPFILISQASWMSYPSDGTLTEHSQPAQVSVTLISLQGSPQCHTIS